MDQWITPFVKTQCSICVVCEKGYTHTKNIKKGAQIDHLHRILMFGHLVKFLEEGYTKNFSACLHIYIYICISLCVSKTVLNAE